jgi:two-component system, LuxR family, sensor kinase FixL
MRTISSIRATFTGAPRVEAQQKYGGRIDGGASAMELRANIHEQVRLDDTRFWLAAIADSSDDAIIAKDLDGLVKSWNRAAETMFGLTAREMIGHSIAAIIPPDRIDEDISIIKRIDRSSSALHFETERQCKDGTIIPVALTVSPIRDDNARLMGVSETAQNLTATQRIQRDLQRREALLRSVLDTVPDAAIVIDKQGFVHSFSAAAIRLFGYRSEEMMGRKVDILLPSSDWDQHNRSPRRLFGDR